MTEIEQAVYRAYDEGRPTQYAIEHLHISPAWARELRTRWRRSHPDAPRDSWRRTVCELKRQGMTDDEIYEWTGYSLETIKTAQTSPIRKGDKVPQEIERAEGLENRNGKLCRSCAYRARDYLSDGNPFCNYICVTGHRRGCPAEKCTKYRRGRKLHEKPFAYH